MQSTTTARFVRTSPRKLGLVAPLARKQPVATAVTRLTHTDKDAARLLKVIIESAAANAVTNHNMKRAGLVVNQILIGPAPTMKRWRPRAQGRAFPVRHRLSHVKVILDEQTLTPAKAVTKAADTTKEPK